MTQDLEVSSPPTAAELARATALALTIAAVVLITTVLPAEYSFDPTGIGARLGLLRQPSVIAGTPPGVETHSLLKAAGPFREDETSLTLDPGKGAEIKATMKKGERFVFTWTAEGPVDFDMHGEATNAPSGEYTSYWKDEGQASGHGAFEAPFDGTHGWYWQNLAPQPVTIRLSVRGFYDKLGRPGP